MFRTGRFRTKEINILQKWFSFSKQLFPLYRVSLEIVPHVVGAVEELLFRYVGFYIAVRVRSLTFMQLQKTKTELFLNGSRASVAFVVVKEGGEPLQTPAESARKLRQQGAFQILCLQRATNQLFLIEFFKKLF